jgi:hypothetical protein
MASQEGLSSVKVIIYPPVAQVACTHWQNFLLLTLDLWHVWLFTDSSKKRGRIYIYIHIYIGNLNICQLTDRAFYGDSRILNSFTTSIHCRGLFVKYSFTLIQYFLNFLPAASTFFEPMCIKSYLLDKAAGGYNCEF